MRSTIYILLCLFITTTTHAQQGSYLDYYRAVASAEEAVVQGNYKDAVGMYQQVFHAYHYNNPIDLYIAAQVAGYMGDTAVCVDLLDKGISFGLPVITINSNPHVAPYFKRLSKRRVDLCRAVYQHNIDTNARTRMLSIIHRDQAVVRNLPRRQSIYDEDGRTLSAQYRPLWDSLLAQVMDITQHSGFPAQKVIGTQTGEDSLFRIGPNSVYALYIFIHHGRAWPAVGNTLWAELLKGNITPQMYGVIYEVDKDYTSSVFYFASRPCQEAACKQMVKDKLPQINEARGSIGLCSYQVMEQKFISKRNYAKWISKGAKEKQPFFDFQCDVNFQGI